LVINMACLTEVAVVEIDAARLSPGASRSSCWAECASPDPSTRRQPEATHGALQFRMSEQQLDGPDVIRFTLTASEQPFLVLSDAIYAAAATWNDYDLILTQRTSVRDVKMV
jgi:hypothetical protein